MEFFGVEGAGDVLVAVLQLGIRVVIAGSAGIRHLRPLHDIDLIVHPDDWDKLAQSGLGNLVTEGRPADNPRYVMGNVEAFKRGNSSWGCSWITIKEADRIDFCGYRVPVWTVAQTARFKRLADRPKDKADIELIRAAGWEC